MHIHHVIHFCTILLTDEVLKNLCIDYENDYLCKPTIHIYLSPIYRLLVSNVQ